MKPVKGMVVNWCTSDLTLGSIKSIRKYYPDMFIYIVDDGTDDTAKMKDYFFITYHDEHMFKYDPDLSKLSSIPNTKLIHLNHHVGHGPAIDYATTIIQNDSQAKWIFHLDSDARLLQPGVIEYMMEGVDDTICQIGAQKPLSDNFPHVHSVCMMYRNDLAYGYGASMRPSYSTGVACGGSFYRTLQQYGFKIKMMDVSKYYIHLRQITQNDEEIKYF